MIVVVHQWITSDNVVMILVSCRMSFQTCKQILRALIEHSIYCREVPTFNVRVIEKITCVLVLVAAVLVHTSIVQVCYLWWI